MHTQKSERYQTALRNFKAAGFNPDRLSAADLASLDPDGTIEKTADELAAAIVAAIDRGDSAALHDLFGRHIQSLPGTNTLAVTVLGVLATELHTLRTRIARLEAHPKGLAYRGTYSSGIAFEVGDVVTFAGSMWHCNITGTADRPGTSGAWQLCVKSGKNGRDAQGAS